MRLLAPAAVLVVAAAALAGCGQESTRGRYGGTVVFPDVEAARETLRAAAP